MKLILSFGLFLGAWSAEGSTVQSNLLNNYLQGIRTGNVSTLKRAFTADAVVHGDYDGVAFNGPAQKMYQALAKNGPSPQVEGDITYLDVQENIALARLEARDVMVAENQRVNRNFTDLYAVLKVGDNWKVVSRVFYTFPKGTADSPVADEVGVRAAITAYVAAVRKGDLGSLKTLYSSDPNAPSSIHGQRDGKVWSGPIAEFYSFIQSRGPLSTFEGEIAPEMQIQGSVATVRLEERQGEQGYKKEYTEMFTLLKVGDHWEIVSQLTYTYPKSREGYVDVVGGKIWYKVFYNDRTAQRTPLVVLTGGPGFPHNDFLMLKKLAEERPIILYDQLGCGKSADIDPNYPDHTVLFTIDRYVDELDRLINHLGYQKVDVLGHSWGTILGFEYYLKHSARVAKLIFQGPAFDLKAWDQDAQYWLEQMPEPTRSTLRQCLKDDTWDADACVAAVDVYDHTHLNRTVPWNQDWNNSFAGFGPEVYLYMNGPNEFRASGALKNYNAMENLHLIHVPTLFIAGKYDSARPATTRRYAREVQGAKVKIFSQSSHCANFEETDAFVETVAKFLR